MKQEIKEPLHLIRLEVSSQFSQPTDHNQDPYVYTNNWQYIFSIVGITVGFGAFWRFPYLVFKNGGGVFLIPYTIAMILIGIPLLYLQTACGQMHRLSLPFIFKKIHPSLKIVGMAILSASFHLSSVYNILLAYCYRFLFTSFNPNLPYADQDITKGHYFKQVILEESESITQFGGMNFSLLFFYILSLIICYYLIKDGAKTSGKIVTFTATAPFVLLLILLIRGIFLDGAFEGLSFLFKPDWSKLWTASIWIDATTQVFFQLSVGLGAIVNLSAMKGRREDILKSVIWVPASLLLCGLLSAATIFVYLSHFCQESGLEINNPGLSLSGLELSFNVIPKALALLPLANLWIFIFFLAMILLGIDSEFGLIETLFCYLRDEYKQGPVIIWGVRISFQTAKYLVLAMISIGGITLASHAGIYYLQFYDYFITNIPFTLWVIVQLYFFVYVFKLSQLTTAIEHFTKIPTPYIIKYCLQSYWLPAYLIINLLFGVVDQIMMYQNYTLMFYLLGWVITMYPIIICYQCIKKEWKGKEQLKLTFQAMRNRQSYF